MLNAAFAKKRVQILKYRVFYSAVRLGEVRPCEAVEMDLSEVYSSVFPLLKEDREFFGLIDSNGTTLQSMYDSNSDHYWFEIPRTDLGGSFGADLSFDAAVDLLKSIKNLLPLKGFDGFEFQSWT